MSQMKLISRRQKQAAHVHRQKIGAVPASNRYSLEQTCARNTDRKDSVANVAMNIAELLGGGGREVVQRQGVGSSRRVRGGHVFF